MPPHTWWHGPRHRGINPRAIVATLVAALLGMLGWLVAAGTQAPASAATIVSSASCRVYDPNLVSGVCLSYPGVGGGTYFTWLGTYRAANGRVFFCIDYRYDSAMKGSPRTISTANLKNQLGRSVGAAEVAALNYLIGRWAPNGPTGDANRDAAIALLIREVMSDGVASNGVVYPPGLKVGGIVSDPIGGLGGTVMALARAMWADAAKFRGPWKVTIVTDASAKLRIGTPRTFTVSLVSASGHLVGGETINFTCSGPVKCPAPIVSWPQQPRKLALTPTAVGPYTISANVAGTPSANGFLYDVGWSSHAGSFATNFGPQRGWIAMSSVQKASAGANAVALPLQPVVATVASAPLVVGDAALYDTVTVKGLPQGISLTASATLWGPFATKPSASSCVATKRIATVTYAVTKVGTYKTPVIRTRGAGYYTWTNFLPATAKSTAVTTPCGIPAETTLRAIQPKITTTASRQSALVGDPISDTYVVSDAEGRALTGTWALLGPIPPQAGSCARLDWAQAPVADSGAIAVPGDGTYRTTPTTVLTKGCYTYHEHLEGTALSRPAESPPGLPSETVVVGLLQPALTTRISQQRATRGDSVQDTVVVTGLDRVPATIMWALLGPLAPVKGSCSDVVWTSAATRRTGTLAVPGDGTYETPPVVLAESGCYTYVESIAASPTMLSASTSPGDPAETTLVTTRTPVLRTRVSRQHALTGSVISDAVDVRGLAERDVIAIDWALLGPIAPLGPTCADLDWTGAAVVRRGQLTARGVSVVYTPGVRLDVPGCYTYREFVAGTTTTEAASSPPGLPSETAVITRPPLPVIPPIPTGGSSIVAPPWWTVWLRALL